MAVEPEIPERNVVTVMRCGYRDDWAFWASIEAARWAGRHVRAIDGGGIVTMYPPLWPGKTAQRGKPKQPRNKASVKKTPTRPVENYLL